jgi:hypothetical protein
MKVIATYLVHKRTEGEWITTSCWVDYEEGMKIGDKVQVDGDSKEWEIFEMYAGSIKEEVIALHGDRAKYGKLVK